MRVPLCAAALLALSGCHAIPIGVVYGLEATGALATIADKVLNIDVSLTQTTPGKTPVAAVLTPPPVPVSSPPPADLAHQPIRTMEPVPNP